MRPREGSIVVGDWDPNNVSLLDPASKRLEILRLTMKQKRLRAPELRWKLEPKKNGTYGSFKTAIPRDVNLVGSSEKDDYDLHEVQGGHGCFLGDNQGMGIDLTEDAWFV